MDNFQQQESNRPMVWVTCRFVKCEKVPRGAGKVGRGYKLTFVVAEAVPGGPPVGTEATRGVRTDPDKLFDLVDPKTGKTKKGVVSAMQELSPHLHSPEQLISECWEIVLPTGIREVLEKRHDQPDWGVAWLGRPTTARQCQQQPTSTGTEYNAGETEGAF